VVSTQRGFITSEIIHPVAIRKGKYVLLYHSSENLVWIEHDVTVISGEFPFNMRWKSAALGGCEQQTGFVQ